MRRVMIWGAMLALSTLAHAGWREASTDNYVIYSEGSRDSLLRFAERVEQFDQILRLMTGVRKPPPPIKLRIYLVSDESTVRELYPVPRPYLAGFYHASPSGGVAIASREHGSGEFALTSDTVLYHEYCHHFMSQYAPASYPVWYSEGFAEYFSSTTFNRDGSVDIGRLAMARLPELVLGTWLPADKLLNDGLSDLPAKSWSQFYGEGWLLTHYLFANSQREHEFRQFLLLRVSGVPNNEALQQTFAPDVHALDSALHRYLDGRRLMARRILKPDLKSPAVSVRELSAAQGELLLPALHAELGVPDAERSKLLATIRNRAAHFPQDPYARTTVALAEARLGDPANAQQMLQRLLEEDATNRRALLESAWLKIHTDSSDDDARVAAEREARTLAVKANRLMNDDPEALLLFYLSFQHEASGPSQNAVAGLERAYEILPQREQTAVLLAHELVRAKRLDEAIRVLRPVAFSPHEGRAEQSENVRRWIQELEGRQSELEHTAVQQSP